MKKIKVFAVLSLLLLSIFSLSGCKNAKATHISSKEDLLLLQNGGNFVLDNDINCEGLSFKAIQNFKGKIDGNGYKIYNVNFISDNNCIGFIGSIDNGEKNRNKDVVIENLGISDFTIDTNLASSDNTLYVGGLLALNWYSNNTTFGDVVINNCYVDGEINVDVNSKDIHVGGMIGFTTRMTTITNCYSDVDIKIDVNNSSFSSSSINIGGFIGETYNYRGYYPTCENVLFTGSIDIDTSLASSLGATVRAGGIYGFADGYNYIKYSLSTPKKISCNSYFDKNVYLGALVGHMNEWEECIQYSYWCDYYDETLQEEEKNLKCSFYSSKYYYGTAVKLYKCDMLKEEFMKGDYTYTDLEGNRKDSFLNFDSSIWNFGYMESEKFVYPTLKVFDQERI